jgi:hypothetical protein
MKKITLLAAAAFIAISLRLAKKITRVLVKTKLLHQMWILLLNTQK